MITAIFSDVHANLPALEKFVRVTKDVVDSYLCLGDMVDYGPWNDECLEIIHSLSGIKIIEGNHEEVFLNPDSVNKLNPLGRDFFKESIKYFSRYDLICNLPKTIELGSFLCIHTIEGKRIYPDTEIEVSRNHLIGHSHYQFTKGVSGKLIVNPGSIGQNRKRIDRVQYALFDTESEQITMHEEIYSFKLFIQELTARNYPASCINYYLNKPGANGTT